MTGPRCSTCGAPLELRRFEGWAERGAVRGLVEAAPVPACPEGHEDPAAVEAFRSAVLHDLSEALLRSSRSRLPWRPERCGACDAPLTMRGRRTTRSVTVTSAEGPPFTVTLDVPMVRCTGCVADNLPGEVWPDVEAATLAALLPGAGA